MQNPLGLRRYCVTTGFLQHATQQRIAMAAARRGRAYLGARAWLVWGWGRSWAMAGVSRDRSGKCNRKFENCSVVVQLLGKRNDATRLNTQHKLQIKTLARKTPPSHRMGRR